MPSLTKGHTFATGDVVTAANLNTLLDDATINNDAVTAEMMAANAVTNTSVSSSAAIELSKLEKPTDGKIIVGRASDGAATAVALSGDATIIADGTLTIADDAITSAKILAGSVTGQKIAMTSDARGDILIRGAANYERLAKPATPAGEVLTFVSASSDPAWVMPAGNEVSVLAGTVSDTSVIPLPDGYTEEQCKWMVGVGTISTSHGDHNSSHNVTFTADSSRVVTTTGIGVGSGVANYIIIGVK